MDSGALFTGGAGNDAFNATGLQFTAGDTLVGGGGTNTLTVSDVTASSAAGVPTGAAVTGIQTMTVTSSGTIGAAGGAAIGVSAGTAEILTITPTAATSGSVSAESIVINGQTYTAGSVSGNTAPQIGGDLALLIAEALGDAVAVEVSGAGVVTVTAAVKGTLIPAISYSVTGQTAGGLVTQAVTAATPAEQVAATAISELLTIALTGAAPDAGDVYTVHFNGTSLVVYTGDVLTDAATAIATEINALYGSTIATAVGTNVTIHGAAGTVLPVISATVVEAGASDAAAATSVIASPAVATTAATAAAVYDVSTFTGLTQFTGTSTGGANIKAAATTNVMETSTGAGAVIVSGGLADTATAAGSVYVSGAKGAVIVSATSVPAASNGFYVAASGTTGLKGGWGTIDTYAPGVLVTGGTTVSVTEKAATITTNTQGAVQSTAVQVGSDANVGKTLANTAVGLETILNSALNPTGNVTVAVSTTYTDTNNLADVAFGNGAVKVYMNGGTTASVKGANSVVITDLGTTALKPSTAGAAVVGTSKLTTVTVDGLNGDSPTAAITTDALTSLTVLNSGLKSSEQGTVTVTNSTVDHALNLTVGNDGLLATPLIVQDDIATSVAVASQASAYQAVNGTAINTGSGSFLTLVTPLATALTFTNAQAVTLVQTTGGQVDAVETITATGSGRLTADVSDPTNWAALTGIDATGSGAVYATITADQSFQGGSGNDKVTIDAIPNYTVDGGTGTNEIVLTSDAAFTGLSTSVTNFQVLGLGADDLSGAASGYSSFASEFDGTSEITGLAAASATITDTAFTSGLALTDMVHDHVTLTVNLGADSASLTGAGATQGEFTLASTTAVTGGTASEYGVAAITINSAGVSNVQVGNGGDTGNNIFTYDYADDLGTITIKGDSAVTLDIGSEHAAKVSLLDASTATGDVTVANSVDTFVATGATIHGGAGFLTTAGSIGADTITVGTGGADLTGTTGGDTITIASGATNSTDLYYADGTSIITAHDAVTGFVNYSATGLSDYLLFDTGVGLMDAQATILQVGGAGTIYYTMTAAGVVTFLNSLGAASPVTSAAALITAAETILAGGSPGDVVAFQLTGNTYVVQDGGSENAATDTVVELVGVTGITALSLSDTAAAHTLLIAIS